MNPLIEQHLDAIRALCREYGVARLEVFGSAATGAFDPDRSAVDFIVEYPADYGPRTRYPLPRLATGQDTAGMTSHTDAPAGIHGTLQMLNRACPEPTTR